MKKGGNKKQRKKCLSHKCAGGVMTKKIPIASIDARIGDIEKILLQDAKKFESINYIYLVNGRNRLKGVISIKELFRQPKNTPVSKVMIKEIISVRRHTNLERVAHLALKHNIKSVPVVDKNNAFLGIISNDTVLYTTYKETREDMLHFAGIHRPGVVVDNIFKLSLWQSFKHRFPWLFIGLLGGIVAAKIIGLFEKTLEENIILAAFLPLMVYMSGAVVTQMQTFIIRDLAINSNFGFIKYFFRQFGVIFLIGVCSSIALYIISFIMYQSVAVGFVLSFALLTAIVSSVAIGLIFPYVLSKMKFDPANASGPIAAVIQDIFSIVVYFSIASWLI